MGALAPSLPADLAIPPYHAECVNNAQPEHDDGEEQVVIPPRHLVHLPDRC